MAAPSLDVDWEAVKAHAILVGVRQAARDFGITESSVKSRCGREGWLAPVETGIPGVGAIAPIPASMKPIASNAAKPSKAARNSLSAIGDKSKLYLAKGVKNTAKALSQKKGDAAIECAGALKATVDAGSKLHGWDAAAQAVSLRLELIASAPNEVVPLTLDAETGEVV